MNDTSLEHTERSASRRRLHRRLAGAILLTLPLYLLGFVLLTLLPPPTAGAENAARTPPGEPAAVATTAPAAPVVAPVQQGPAGVEPQPPTAGPKVKAKGRGNGSGQGGNPGRGRGRDR